MKKQTHMTFQEILDTLRDKHGDGFYRFKIRDGRVTGLVIYEPQNERADEMDDVHASFRFEDVKNDQPDCVFEKPPRIYIDRREKLPSFGNDPRGALK